MVVNSRLKVTGCTISAKGGLFYCNQTPSENGSKKKEFAPIEYPFSERIKSSDEGVASPEMYPSP